jgi:hypothetical protein
MPQTDPFNAVLGNTRGTGQAPRPVDRRDSQVAAANPVLTRQEWIHVQNIIRLTKELDRVTHATQHTETIAHFVTSIESEMSLLNDDIAQDAFVAGLLSIGEKRVRNRVHPRLYQGGASKTLTNIAAAFTRGALMWSNPTSGRPCWNQQPKGQQ